MKLTVNTTNTSKHFTSLSHFMVWNAKVNNELIIGFEMETEKGNSAGSGINAGADLFEIIGDFLGIDDMEEIYDYKDMIISWANQNLA